MAATTAAPKKGEKIWEICDSLVEDGEMLCGCELCGRMYGPCCNNPEGIDSLCAECS